jgi:tetratricopeptide (TPR) repeat protein
MRSHQFPIPTTAPVNESNLLTGIDAKTAERYWQIFWCQAILTIAAYLYLIGDFQKDIIYLFCSIIWINVAVFELAIVPSIVMHELGHAIAARLLDVKISRFSIGIGKIICQFKAFEIPCEIHQFPIGGMITILQKSTEFYRLKYFLIVLAGPLTHIVVIAMLCLTDGHTLLPTFINFRMCLLNANLALLVWTLLPYGGHKIYVDEVEKDACSDGLLLLKIPFLTDRQIGDSIASVHLREGWAHLEAKDYGQAIKSFHAALKIDPNLVTAYQGKGLIHQYLQDFPEAIDNFSRVIGFDRRNALAYLYRGICYIDWGKNVDTEEDPDLVNYQNAIADLNTAILLDRTLVSAYQQRATINFYLGNVEQSISDFTEIIERTPSATAYYNRAVTIWEFTEDRSALTDLDLAISLDPNFVAAYYWLGNIYYQLGDAELGLQKYASAQSVEDLLAMVDDENDEHSLFARGVARARMGDRDGAIVDLEKAAELCGIYKNTATAQRIRSTIAEWNLA